MRKVLKSVGILVMALGLFFGMSLMSFAADDDIAGGVIDEEYGQITWRIDKNGHLTVEGWGDVSDQEGVDRAPWYPYREKIISAKIKTERMKNASWLFTDCRNITCIDLTKFKTNSVTDMYGLFSGCINLKELDVSTFDTRNVVRMVSMFSGCSSLKKLDLNNFDTSNVEYMGTMFAGCSSLIKLNVSNFDTGNVKYMESMFAQCSSLTELDVSNFNTEKVVNMMCMFEKCYALKKLNLGAFDTSRVTDMAFMFADCFLLQSIDVSNFDTRKVTIMEGMFMGCRSVTFLDLSNFKTDSLKHAYGMLKGCYSLEKVIPLVGWNLWTDLPRQYATQKWYLPNGTVTYDLNQKWPDGTVITKGEVFGLKDVFEDEWFYPYVQYVFKKGLMNGYDDFFTPNDSMSRAMVVQTLYNMENRPEVTDYKACEELKDVHQDWYTDAVCWAYNEGITTGYDDSKTFKVDEPVTREQLAAFLYRYAEYKGYDKSQVGDLSYLQNADKVSLYAKEAVSWAVGTKLINGVELKNNYGSIIGRDLAPQGEATRGQMAAILQRFCEGYKITFPNKTVHIPGDAFEWNGHLYAIFDNCLTWQAAEEYCKSRGGHLAVIESAEENEALYNFIKEKGYTSAYFGLSDTAEEGTWSWVNGEATDYTNWNADEPGGGRDENYAMFFYLYEDGTWNDGAFKENVHDGGNAYICEWE